MRKSFLFIFSLLSIGLCTAQVGVNTRNPQGAFHIDSRSNTTGTPATPATPVNDLDDVIVANDGKVGIGTMAPTTLLDIRTGGTASSPIPGFQLQDGNEAAGRVLVSDATGLGTWVDVAPIESVAMIFPPNSGVDIGFNNPNYYNTTANITLPPGRWAMNAVTALFAPNGTVLTPVWLNTTLGDASTIGNSGGSLAAIKSPDIEGTGLISTICWSQLFSTVTGTFVINNTSGVNKTYYYVIGGTSSFGVPVAGNFLKIGSAQGETNFLAFRIPTNL